MCGRFTLTSENREWVAQQLGVPPEQLTEEDFRPRFNIAPMQRHWIVRGQREEREALRARWGLVNVWAKDNSRASRQINARGETFAERPAYRSAFRARRCVVPADGFYEWSGAKGKRQPHWIRPADGGLLLFAGLYEDWHPEPGKVETTVTNITTEPNAITRPIHDRMPVLLPEGAVDHWLSAPDSETKRLQELLAPAPDDLLTATSVSTLVNSVRNDGPELIEAV